ncbi:hypothetical protein [Dyella sp. 2YAF14]
MSKACDAISAGLVRRYYAHVEGLGVNALYERRATTAHRNDHERTGSQQG